MSYDINATFSEQQTKLEGSKPLDLYAINASPTGTDLLYFANYNQDVMGFSLNATDLNLRTATQLYTGFPIERGDLSSNTSGEIAEVSVNIPNVDRVIESVIQTKDYLRGQDVYFITMFSDNLPVNASRADYIGTDEDRNSALIEKFFVDGVSSDEKVVSFSCKPKFVLKNITVPGRRFSRDCSWTYGASECLVNATTLASYPTCDLSIDSCKERSNLKRFGGFPSIPTRGVTII